MRYVLLIAAVLFLLGAAVSYLGFGGLDGAEDIATAKDIVGVVLALAVLYLWYSRRGGPTAI
jgi:hypothetical protein